MKLTKINISGYKSIDDLEFPVKKYGSSYTTILLGKNETGKSNVLEALSLLAEMNRGTKVDFASIKKQVDPEPEMVYVRYSFELEDRAYRDFIAGKISAPDAIINKIEVAQAVEVVYLQDGDDRYNKKWEIVLTPSTLKDAYYEQKSIPNNSGDVQKVYTIKYKKDLVAEETEKYSELTWDKFNEILQPMLEEYFCENEISVSVWRAKDSDLIQDNISLKEFSENPSICPSLSNMFALSGFTDKEQIQKKIQEIAGHPNLQRKLEKTLSEKSSEHISSKWKEHKVKIDVRITDELNIHTMIQDQDNTNCYYNMQDRSVGFKQFISLLLSISIKNQTGSIKNNLIVIDEPEIHLHPSGIRYMLEELLKIGENNYVFLATHSNFMVDNKTKDRHFLLTKEHGLTHAKQIISDVEISDDEILQTAFGINPIRDFLSPYRLLLEGASDKTLLRKALKQVDDKLDIGISNSGGSKIVSVASMMAFNNVPVVVVVDDDRAGIGFKKSILEIKGIFDEKTVFTIRDLNGSLKNSSTIEDTLPSEYLGPKTNEILLENSLPEMKITEDSPFIEQLKKHLLTEISKDGSLSKDQQKEKLNDIIDAVKTNISDSYSEKNIEKNAPLLYALAEAIMVKLKS